MGIPRPYDPYDLTAPPAWPEVDEDLLRTNATAFEDVSSRVGAQLTDAHRERLQLFGGSGLWSGIAADIASRTLNDRISALESAKRNLDTAAKLLGESVSATVSTKNAITHTVEIANEILDWIRTREDIPEDAKTAAINEGIAAIRSENISLIATAGAGISGAPSALNSDSSDRDDLHLLQDMGAEQQPAFVPASNVVDSQGPASIPNSPAGEQAVGGVETDGLSSSEPSAPDELPTAIPSPAPDTIAVNDVAPSAPSQNPTAISTDLEMGAGSAVPPAFSGIPATPTGPAAPAPPRISAPTSPLSSAGSSTPSVPATPPASTSPSMPSTVNPAAAAPTQTPMADFQSTMAESAAKAVAQAPIPPPQSAPIAASAMQPSNLPPVSDTPPTTPSQTTAPPAAGPTTTGQAPVAPLPSPGGAPTPPVPLGPPPSAGHPAAIPLNSPNESRLP